MHRIHIIGNVGRKSELRYVQSGKPVLSFPLASSNGKDENGTDRPPTWFDCSIWDDALNFQHITKGMRLEVTGRVSSDAWIKDGAAKSKIRVNVTTISPLGPRPNSDSDQSTSNNEQPIGGNGGGSKDEQIPF